MRELRKRTDCLPDDYWVVLTGDLITEEALPTYMAMLNTLDGVRDETVGLLYNSDVGNLSHSVFLPGRVLPCDGCLCKRVHYSIVSYARYQMCGSHDVILASGW